MCDVTRILGKMEAGDPLAAEQLLTLIYDELRKLAADKMAQEKPGQTLQATALVHEAYIRLVDAEKAQLGFAWALLRGSGRGDAADHRRGRPTQTETEERWRPGAGRCERGRAGLGGAR